MRPPEILLVEDSPVDARLTKTAFNKGMFPIHLSVVDDGVQALDFLRRHGGYAEAPTPDLILLDLNLPNKSGHELLHEIKADPDCMRIPVIVLTASAADTDVQSAYAGHANCYIPKPQDPEEFVKMVYLLKAFWLTVVKLPSPDLFA